MEFAEDWESQWRDEWSGYEWDSSWPWNFNIPLHQLHSWATKTLQKSVCSKPPVNIGSTSFLALPPALMQFVSEVGVFASSTEAAVTANMALAMTALENDEFDAALAASLRVITAKPGLEKEADALFCKGYALYCKGTAETEDADMRLDHLEEAIAAFQESADQSARLRNGDSDSWDNSMVNKGASLWLTGEADRAISTYREVLRQSPAHTTARGLLTVSLIVNGNVTFVDPTQSIKSRKAVSPSPGRSKLEQILLRKHERQHGRPPALSVDGGKSRTDQREAEKNAAETKVFEAGEASPRIESQDRKRSQSVSEYVASSFIGQLGRSIASSLDGIYDSDESEENEDRVARIGHTTRGLGMEEAIYEDQDGVTDLEAWIASHNGQNTEYTDILSPISIELFNRASVEDDDEEEESFSARVRQKELDHFKSNSAHTATSGINARMRHDIVWDSVEMHKANKYEYSTLHGAAERGFYEGNPDEVWQSKLKARRRSNSAAMPGSPPRK